MAIDWSLAVKDKAATLLARVRVAQQDTPLKLLEELRARKFEVALAGDNLKITPKGITDEDRTRLKKHKAGLLVILREPPKFDFPVTWEAEWTIEIDLLQRRRAAAWTPTAKRELDIILAIPKPQTDEEWHSWGTKHLETCYESLKPRGELPPAIYAAADLWKVLAHGSTEQPAGDSVDASGPVPVGDAALPAVGASGDF
jgi:hypothetical protein